MGAVASNPKYVEQLAKVWPTEGEPFDVQSFLGGEPTEHEPKFLEPIKDAFNRALLVSLKAHKGLVGTEHLLRGLIEGGCPSTIDILFRLNVSSSRVLDQLDELIS